MMNKKTAMKVILISLLCAVILISASCMKSSTGTGGTSSVDLPESSSVGSGDLPSGSISSDPNEGSSRNPDEEASKKDDLMETLMNHPESPEADFELCNINTYWKTAHISKYTGNSEIVVIPAKIKGMTIVEVASEAFYEHPTVRAVRLADTIERVGSYAFASCSELEIFVCGSGTKEFVTRTFAKSRKLRKVLLNEGLESVGSHSFNSCLALKEIVMPSTIDDVMAHTFWCFERTDKLNVYYPAGNEALDLLKEEIDSAEYTTTCVLIPR